MKRGISLSLMCIFIVVFLFGCGHSEVQMRRYEVMEKAIDLKLQQEMNKAYIPDALKNDTSNDLLLSIEMSDDGKSFKKLSVGNPYALMNAGKPKKEFDPFDIPEPAPHPVWKWTTDLGDSLLHSPVATFLGLGYLQHVIGKNQGHNVTNTNSGNNGSYNNSDSGMAIATENGSAGFDGSSHSNSSVNGSYNPVDESDNSTYNENYSYANSNNPDSSTNGSYNPVDNSGQDNSQRPDNSIKDSYNPINNEDQYSGDTEINNFETPVP